MSVKFKAGLMSAYNAITNKDNDTLYFITDKGLIYKGTTLFCAGVKSVSESNGTLTFTLHDDSTVTASFLTTAHSSVSATGSVKGHVTLSDSTSSTSAASAGVGATPKAVKDALAAAKSYADGLLGANDAMVFKGTLGTNGTIAALPASGYQCGWTYRVITAGTHAGVRCEEGDLIICIKDGPASGSSIINEDWTVAQTNIDGAVTTGSTLTNGAVMLGAGNHVAKILANGSNGQVLKMVSGSPAWAEDTDTNTDTKVTVANSTSKMYLMGTANATGNQTGVSNTAVYATNGTLTATKFSGSGASLTNLPAANITGAATSVTSGSSTVVTSGAVYTHVSNVLSALEWGTF